MADGVSSDEIIGQLRVPAAAGIAGQALQLRAQAAFAAHTFAEHWKYTRVDEFLGALPELTPAEPRISGLDQPGISLTRRADVRAPVSEPVHADARASARVPAAASAEAGASSQLGPADESSHARFPLADLALMVSGDLLTLRLRQSLPEPIEIVHQEGLSIPLLCVIDPGVEVTLIERSAAERVGNQSLYLHIAEGARVNHASAGLLEGASHWALAQVRVENSAHYARQQYVSGGRRRRVETQVLLCGRDASAEIVGAYVVRGGTHLDQQLVVEHRSPATFSRQKFHGIGAGKGTAIFNGRIHIHPDAPGSDAALSNRNLALHPDATINTKPELEIYTDDVKCAHGATVGQIAEDGLFYLRSRGVDELEARRMLCRAFLAECIEGPLAETVEQPLLDFQNPNAA